MGCNSEGIAEPGRGKGKREIKRGWCVAVLTSECCCSWTAGTRPLSRAGPADVMLIWAGERGPMDWDCWKRESPGETVDWVCSMSEHPLWWAMQVGPGQIMLGSSKWPAIGNLLWKGFWSRGGGAIRHTMHMKVSQPAWILGCHCLTMDLGQGLCAAQSLP